ncbi:SCL-interrupting locus protein homolog [Echeneis naucrates]|uniref:SCL-interrupting locus protein homolog n=1 Tax=Echeneis naucrates TaxID=173247 RepID=UPI0011133B9C|nr:SCL-interrupting locus protein [Echeneis naucrates]
MSCPVNLKEVLVSETGEGRSSNSLTPLSFSKSRSALWQSSPAGEMLRLQFCSHRNLRVVLLEKPLCLAQRHVRHRNKPNLQCFFLGSVSVDSDEEGITITLDRFDPGRDQTRSSGRVPTALLPGDILVPCLFSTQAETSPDTVVHSEAELHYCFKALQQFVSSRQPVELCQLFKVRGQVVWTQQSDAAVFGFHWSAVYPFFRVDVQPVQAVPIIPTALLRSLTSINWRLQQHATTRQRGFLTMDQTKKLLLLLESDPKASNLPLVGLWVSGVSHLSNPQVMSWCLRFLFSSALQNRVLSESGCFLLVLFASTHRAPQFFQCRGPGTIPGPGSGLQLYFELLTGFQSVTLYQGGTVAQQTLQCELVPEDQGRQTEIFRQAQISFNSAPPPGTGLSVSDQDSGVEDEDLSPRPSPSPHPPAQQTRRVQPSVPELSLIIDSSFSNRSGWQYPGPAHRPRPPADTMAAPPTECSSATTPISSAPRPPPHLHSTPTSVLQHPCSCCPAQSYIDSAINSPGHCPALLHSAPLQSSLDYHAPPHSKATPPSHNPSSALPPNQHHHSPPPPSHFSPPLPPCPSSHSPHVSPSHPAKTVPSPCDNPCCDQLGGAVASETYQLLLHQDQQLRLLQAQVKMLLEAQGRLQGDPPRTASIAVGTGASLFWGDPAQSLPHQDVLAPPLFSSTTPSSSKPLSNTPSRSSSSHDASIIGPVGGAEDDDTVGQRAPMSHCPQQSGLQSPVLGESVSMYRPAVDQQSFYTDLMNQLTNRLQDSDSKQEGESKSLCVVSDHSLSSSSSSSIRRKQQNPRGDPMVSATLRQLQHLGVNMDEDLMVSDRSQVRAVESASTLASINPAAVLSRLRVSDPTISSLFPGGSVDLSLEANAIALRYLSDSQLNRLSLGSHAPLPDPPSSSYSLLSPSNMSLATRKYMKRYGLIEKEDGEDEEELGEISVQEVSTCQPLTEVQDVNLLPQSQLIRDLQPKMQLLARSTKENTTVKENCPSRQSSLVRGSSHQADGSVGNILDLIRLRQLPKFF